MSILGRKNRMALIVGQLRREWEAQEPPARAQLEIDVGEAVKLLRKVCAHVPNVIGELFIEAVIMAISDGFVGGNWAKVKRAIRDEFPLLWEHTQGLFVEVTD